MSRVAACLVVAWAHAAVAQLPEPPPPAPEAVEPAPEPEPAESAAELDALLAEKAPLARATKLLGLVRRLPPGPLQLRALEEARRAVEEAIATPVSDPLSKQVIALLGEPDPTARAGRSRSLAVLGDARAVAPLGYVARRDADPAVRIAAFDALASFRSAEVERVALESTRDRAEAPEVRAAAARTLGAQRSRVAEDALVAIVQNADYPAPLRQAATDMLLLSFPARAAELRLAARVGDSSGRLAMLAIGGASGAYLLGSVGALAPNNALAPVIGVFGGLVVGAVAGQVLGSTYDLSLSDSLLLASYGAWSVPVGVFAGLLPFNRYETPPTPAIMLTTHLAALSAAWLLRRSVQLSEVDAVELNASAVAAMLVVAGLVNLPEPGSDRRLGFAALGLAPVVGLGVGTALAPRLKLTTPLAGLGMLALVEGGLLGGLLGGVFVPGTLPGPLGAGLSNPSKGRQVGALTAIGIGLGGAALLFTTPLWNPTVSEATVIGFGAVAGNMLAGAAPLLVAGDDGVKASQIGVALGGVAGGVAAGFLTRPLGLELRGGDSLLLGLGSLFSVWQGVGWASWLGAGQLVDPARSTALALGTIGVGTVASLAVARGTDLSPAHAGWIFSGAVWGGYLAFLGSLVASADSSGVLGATLVGSDVGFAAGALLLSPLVQVDPAVLAWASVGGLGGAVLASLAWALVAIPGYPGEGVRFGIFNLIGTTLGLAIGAGLGATVFRSAPALSLPGVSLPPPMVSAMPVVSPDGSFGGAGAQLFWAL